MITSVHPKIKKYFNRLLKKINNQKINDWLKKDLNVSLINLIYLCKFTFFTGLTTKAEIGYILKLTPAERRCLVKSWYDDHRKKGCGIC